ncbi:hypothetical protein ABZX92_14280 [Lentzea sp. NPDC006480]|uniref:alpha-galactosidase n=1 Tax=Lentzea sp. NPDC006480 TaxID=3157176 RepID=UPI0033A62BA6
MDARARYRAMHDALVRTGRPIVLSIGEWGENQPWLWAAGAGHLWRTTGDISDSWSSMLSIFKQNVALAGHVVRASGGVHVLSRPLANGDVAVALFNENTAAATISTDLREVGLGAGTYSVRDLWTGAVDTTASYVSASATAAP